MSGANFPRVKTWVSTEDVTYSDLNAEFDNMLNNLTAANVDDFSASVSQMQSTADPGEVGTESLATSVAGEVQRLRKLIGEITGKTQWYESPVASIAGLANAVGTGQTANRLVSGKVRSSSNVQPIFLNANGAAKTVNLKGSATNFHYYVNGTEYTITTDVILTGLTAAPSTNNTCLVNESGVAAQFYTKFSGEDGSAITVDTMGSEISALAGKFAAFKLAGAATEYFIAYVKSSTSLTKACRGYFFDSTDAPVKRTTYTDNDVITLMKLTWVFAKSDGTLTATYNNPVWSSDEPSSPAVGDYWFDIANNTWKIYGVGSFSSAGATLVGCCIQDATNTVAARSFEFFAAYSDLNTVNLVSESNSQVKSRFAGANLNVWGLTIPCDHNIRTWDMTLDLDSGVSEAATTYYYFYITSIGDQIISDVKPYDRREDLRGYYHPHSSWRCVGRALNDGSQNLSEVESYYIPFKGKVVRQVATTDLAQSYRDDVLVLSGTSFTQTLSTAVGNRGKILDILHGGTSLTQVYTLATFGGETIGGIASGSYALYTNGESLRLMSDGTNWLILSHRAETAWSANATSTLVMTTGVKGTGTVVDIVRWRRRGQVAEFYFEYSHTVAGTGASDIIKITVPGGLTMDSSLIALNSSTDTSGLQSPGVLKGSAGLRVTATAGAVGNVVAVTTTTVKLSTYGTSGTAAWGTSTCNLSSAALGVSAWWEAPITGWQP